MFSITQKNLQSTMISAWFLFYIATQEFHLGTLKKLMKGHASMLASYAIDGLSWWNIFRIVNEDNLTACWSSLLFPLKC